jgi:Asp/Glu/hydantoin racemase
MVDVQQRPGQVRRVERAEHLLGQGAARTPGAKPRLLWIEASEARPGLARLWEFLDAYLKDLSGDDFDTEMVAFPTSGGGVRQPGARLLSEALALAAVTELETEADLIILNDWAQPFYQLRAMLSVPVTGICEASVVLGNVLARRPAIVTVAEGMKAGVERDLYEIGLLDRMAQPAVWWIDPPTTHEEVQDAIDRPESLVGKFDAVAHRAVDAGADAILVGCGYYGPVFAKHDYTHVSGRDDVPVYDCGRLGFEMARTLYSLFAAGVGPSRRGFPQLVDPNLSAARKLMARIITAG